ncbi:MAG: peptidoglycan-associated lipoprotein Pal [bacterium]|nr:peptidoglycan-associated lipoprotein Pal [bacterium]MDD5354621.1 peptidoglycan-associated lipoprotein Pal [bacterium]MDD5757015.1 peptidoglycan-associated lipoprotein Pal [bacterium]
MNKRLLLSGCIMVLALFLLGGCTKKAVRSTPDEAGTSRPTMSGDDTETDSDNVNSGAIPPENSARGLDFGAIVNVALEDVYFGFDEYTLTKAALGTLAQNVEILKSNSKIIVQIEGHADERGTVEYNLALGQKRASAVRTYLINAGIDSGRIFTISYGKERPIDPGHNEGAWAKNRRAHFTLAVK